MTSANDFIINGDLAPIDADAAFESLKAWLAADERGTIQISPLPAFPELPTQTALQMLLAAMAEFSDSAAERLHPETLTFCTCILGDSAFETKSTSRTLEAENG